MKQLVVISGKGGTGKTTLVASFSALAQNKVLADCDVDAADLFLLFEPKIKEKGDFCGGRKPEVDEERCTGCGTCTELCRFNAIQDGKVDYVECEGCGLCALACPEEAIRMVAALSGWWYRTETKNGPMVYAQLKIGEENSGKLVAEVRERAKRFAEGEELVIIDGPPGVGCPVISSITGADLALVVTEPSASGLHDLERAVGLCRHFQVPVKVCINKVDINPSKTKEIEEYCQREGIEVVGKIPFDRKVIEALVEGKSPLEYPTAAREEIERVWERVKGALFPQGGGDDRKGGAAP